MANTRAHIEIVGLKELQAQFKRIGGDMPKAQGQAHKEVGKYIIAKLPRGNPHAVGEGSGSYVRASATKRDVVLRAGSSARAERAAEMYTRVREQQWGEIQVQPFASGRPYILGPIEENPDEIKEKFQHEISKVAAQAGLEINWSRGGS